MSAPVGESRSQADQEYHVTVPPDASTDPTIPLPEVGDEPRHVAPAASGPQAPPPDPRHSRGLSRRDKLAIAGLAAVGVLLALLMVVPQVLSTMNAMANLTTPQEYVVTRTQLTDKVTLSGTIAPTQRLDLSFTSQGKVTSVAVSVGDAVGAGTRLASIDDTELRAAVADARSEAEAARKDYEDARRSGSSAEVTALRSAYTVKQQALKDAEAALDKATLVSTIDGVVAAVNVHVGDTAGSASGAPTETTVGNTGSSTSADVVVISNSFQVDATVGSSDRPRVSKGMRAVVTTATSSAPLSGSVTALGVVADQSSTSADGTRAGAVGFPVTVTIEGTPPNVFTGSSATVDLFADDANAGPGVLTVPLAAVTRQSETAGQVNVKRGDTVATVAVTLGATQGDMVEVVSGLSEGDVVVYVDLSTMPGMAGGAAGARSTP